MKKVAFHNLGCKVNAYELDLMKQRLFEDGYEEVTFEETADLYVINTCTVTNIADRKSRQMLHRAKKRNPGAVVAAVGCYVDTHAEETAEALGIDLCIGNDRKHRIAEIVAEFMHGRKAAGEESSKGGQKGKPAGDDCPENSPERTAGLHQTAANSVDTMQSKEKAANVPGRFQSKEIAANDLDRSQSKEIAANCLDRSQSRETARKFTGERCRVFLKIQDGCNQFCSYCIIPYARGRVRSRKPEEILEEVKKLVGEGYQEFVLTGIHISSYGTDFSGAKPKADLFGPEHLLDLLRRLSEIPEIRRLRLGSLEPRIISRDFLQELVSLPKVCPHFHLSLQSGCNATLQRMNRHYSAEEFMEKVNLLREYYPHPAVTTDVIVGFPGETEEEFEESMAFLNAVSFFEMHIFKYSKRRNTPAAVMPGQLTEAAKAKRSSLLEQMEQEKSVGFRSYYLGRESEVLFEECKEIDGRSYWIGHTPEYVMAACPASELPKDRCLVNEIHLVRFRALLKDVYVTGNLM